MIFAVYKDKDGETKGGLYSTYRSYIEETFCPDCEEIGLVEFKVKEKTYSERKDNAEEIAKEIQYLAAYVDLFWSEVAWIGSWFDTIGKRYGLLREFRENGIC
jgi:hypothetical protein